MSESNYDVIPNRYGLRDYQKRQIMDASMMLALTYISDKTVGKENLRFRENWEKMDEKEQKKMIEGLTCMAAYNLVKYLVDRLESQAASGPVDMSKMNKSYSELYKIVFPK